MPAPRVTIAELPEQTSVLGTELVVVQDGSTTKKMTMSKITQQDLAPRVSNLETADTAFNTRVSQIETVNTGQDTAIAGLRTDTGNLDLRIDVLETTSLLPDTIDAGAFGVVGDGVADDTAALQAFLNASPKRVHFLRSPSVKYRTTSTLTIPDAPGYHLYGESRWNTIIEADFSNAPILKTSGIFQHNYVLEQFELRFKTNQSAANTNAVGLLFAGPAGSEMHFYDSRVSDLRISGARVGIDNLRNPGQYQAVWNNVFDRIQFTGISYSLIHIESAAVGGHPINNFRMITSVASAGTGAALDFLGVEFSIDGLDVEDWAGMVVKAYSGGGTVRGVHVERHATPNASMVLFGFSDGGFTFDTYNIHFAASSTSGHYIVNMINGRLNLGTGYIDTALLTVATGMCLLLASGTAQVNMPMLPIHAGNATWYAVGYFPWETTSQRLLMNHGSVVWDPASMATNTQTSTTLTVDGAAIGDVVAVGFSVAVPAGVLLVGSVTAANTVTATLMNHTAGTVNLVSGTLRARIWKAL